MWQIGCSVRFSDWSVLVQDKAHSCSLSQVSLCTQLLFLVSDFDQMPSLSSEAAGFCPGSCILGTLEHQSSVFTVLPVDDDRGSQPPPSGVHTPHQAALHPNISPSPSIPPCHVHRSSSTSLTLLQASAEPTGTIC